MSRVEHLSPGIRDGASRTTREARVLPSTIIGGAVLPRRPTTTARRAADVNPDLSGNENDQLRFIARWFGRV